MFCHGERFLRAGIKLNYAPNWLFDYSEKHTIHILYMYIQMNWKQIADRVQFKQSLRVTLNRFFAIFHFTLLFFVFSKKRKKSCWKIFKRGYWNISKCGWVGWKWASKGAFVVYRICIEYIPWLSMINIEKYLITMKEAHIIFFYIFVKR